jgi:prophage regulatory protein
MEVLMLDSTEVRLLNSADLYKLGITYARQTLPRLEKAGQFPRRVKLTPKGSVRWVESEIHDWLRDRISKSRGNPPKSPPPAAPQR